MRLLRIAASFHWSIKLSFVPCLVFEIRVLTFCVWLNEQFEDYLSWKNTLWKFSLKNLFYFYLKNDNRHKSKRRLRWSIVYVVFSLTRKNDRIQYLFLINCTWVYKLSECIIRSCQSESIQYSENIYIATSFLSQALVWSHFFSVYF